MIDEKKQWILRALKVKRKNGHSLVASCLSALPFAKEGQLDLLTMKEIRITFAHSWSKGRYSQSDGQFATMPCQSKMFSAGVRVKHG